MAVAHDEVGTPVDALAHAAAARWRRRVRLGLAVGGVADGLALTALVGVAALLALRLFGVHATPHPAWAAAAVVPALLAVVRVRARDLPLAVCAAHLDRRLGMEGMLVAGTERDASAWRPRLADGLAGARDAAPRVRWGRAATRTLVPWAALGGVLLLPPPYDPVRGPDAAIVRALADVERRLEALAQARGLREETRDALRERVAEVKARAERGEPLSWADVDAAADRLVRDAERRAADLARARAALGAFAREAGASGGGEKARADLAHRLDEAGKAGLLEGLPETLQATVDGARRDGASAGGTKDGASTGTETDHGVGQGGIDPSRLPEDAEAMKALAEAMAATAGERLEGVAAAGAISAEDLAALEALLEGDPLAKAWKETDGEPCTLCHGDRPEGCGG